ncbi:MAG: hypothetical protein QME75_04110 [Deltaproteobacteria bacterium]|nr:hypothetical protein [Deltaproteobacteria bacterium]
MSDPSIFQVRILTVPWLIPTWAKAQAWWNVILVRRGVDLNDRLLAHELAHVLQWRALGVLPFIFHYVRHLISHGYEAHPLEVHARTAEKSGFYRKWAKEILTAGKGAGPHPGRNQTEAG